MNLITIAPCQHNEPLAGSAGERPLPFYPIRRLYHLLKTVGPGQILRKACVKIQNAYRAKSSPRAITPDEVLSLQPGEWVEIKSEADIRATLDARGTNRGLAFVEEMSWYYGRQFKVYKRLQRLFLEESKQYRRLKNTVLLEGVHCQGTGIDCDRACHLFWREVWLKRVPPPAGESLPL